MLVDIFFKEQQNILKHKAEHKTFHNKTFHHKINKKDFSIQLQVLINYYFYNKFHSLVFIFLK